MQDFPIKELNELAERFYLLGVNLDAIVLSNTSLWTMKRPGWNTMELNNSSGSVKILTEAEIKSKVRHMVSESVIKGNII